VEVILFGKDRTLRNVTFVVAAIVALAASCFARTSAEDVKAQIQAAYDGQCTAAIARDGAAFQTSFGPNFVATEADGKQQSLAQALALVGAPPAGWRLAECSFSIRGLTIDSQSATVRVTRRIRGTFTQGILTEPFTQVQDSNDTWSLAGAPLQTASVATAVLSTLGNKVVDQRGTLSGSAPSNSKKGL
jgi:hypothetical protein